jgi:hypothetical protein
MPHYLWMNQENVVFIHNGFYSATKKNEILSFRRKWMELENIIFFLMFYLLYNTQRVQRGEKGNTLLTKRAYNFIFTFHNTNENCCFFCPTSPLQNYSLDKNGEQVLPVMLLENTQSHSTMISWWSRTSNIKLTERGLPSIFIYLVGSFLVEWAPSWDELEVSSLEAQASLACGLPWVASFQELQDKTKKRV